MNRFRKRKGKFKFLSMVMAMLLAVGSIAFAIPNKVAAFVDDQQVIEQVDGQRALAHIKNLSENIGPRVAGTLEESRAAKYIQEQFEKLGYKVELQTFNIKNTVARLYMDSGGNGKNANPRDQQEIRAYPAVGSGYTQPQGITAPIIDCRLGEQMGDFPKGVQGNIALIQRGVVTFAEKVQNAVRAGAAGVIIYNNEEGLLTPALTPYNSPIPVVSIAQSDGEAVIKQGGRVGTIKAELKTKSQNVIATRLPHKEEGRQGIVYVTAHYDSVPLAPGANDNASGTAALLEMARVLRAFPIDKEIRFIGFGSEEIGLDGSEYYVSQLTDEEITRSIANFNMDMVATSYDKCKILYADTVDGAANLVSDAALKSGARLGKDLLAVNYGRASDHAPFGDFGIPAACFIWGDANGKLEPWYHTPKDNSATNLSVGKFQSACEVIGSAIKQVLRLPVASFDRNPLDK